MQLYVETKCEAIAKYAADKLGVSLPPESLKESKQYCEEWATARVLKYRAEKKKFIEMERFRFSFWSYIRKKDSRVETFEAEGYSDTANDIIVLRCVDSKDEEKYASGIDIRVTSVGRKFPDQDVVMLDIYLDGKPSPSRSMGWAFLSERIAITLGPNSYVLAEYMKKSNYIEIKHQSWPDSLKFSLSGSAKAIGQVEKSCRSFDKLR